MPIWMKRVIWCSMMVFSLSVLILLCHFTGLLPENQPQKLVSPAPHSFRVGNYQSLAHRISLSGRSVDEGRTTGPALAFH